MIQARNSNYTFMYYLKKGLKYLGTTMIQIVHPMNKSV